MSRLLLLDMSNLFYRAYHAAGEARAVAAALDGASDAARALEPTHLVAVFDWGRSAGRLALHPEYKANRPEDHGPGALARLEELVGLLESLGVSAWRERGVEADDAIAAAVRRLGPSAEAVAVVSGDKDLRQLASERTTVYSPHPGLWPGQRWAPEDVAHAYGVPPQRLPELFALAGDKSDNVPGVPGVGLLTARRLLERYGGLQELALSDEPKIAGHRRAMAVSYELVLLHPEWSSFDLDLGDIVLEPMGLEGEGADRAREGLRKLGPGLFVERWESGTLWRNRGRRLGKG